MRTETKLVIHIRVLFALVMREMTTRYGRNPGGYVWAVLDPVGTIAGLSFVFSFIARHPPLGASFPLFFATGYMAFYFYADISRNVSLAVNVNRPLLTFPRVTILDTILARIFLHFLTASFVSFLVIGVLWWWDPHAGRVDVSMISTAISLATLLGASMGLLNCALFSYSPTWQIVFGIVTRPLFLISGIFFIYESLPRIAQDVLWWNPLLHITAIMRRGFYADYTADFASPLYVVLFAAAPLLTAILLLRALRGRMLEQ